MDVVNHAESRLGSFHTKTPSHEVAERILNWKALDESNGVERGWVALSALKKVIGWAFFPGAMPRAGMVRPVRGFLTTAKQAGLLTAK